MYVVHQYNNCISTYSPCMGVLHTCRSCIGVCMSYTKTTTAFLLELYFYSQFMYWCITYIQVLYWCMYVIHQYNNCISTRTVFVLPVLVLVYHIHTGVVLVYVCSTPIPQLHFCIQSMYWCIAYIQVLYWCMYVIHQDNNCISTGTAFLLTVLVWVYHIHTGVVLEYRGHTPIQQLYFYQNFLIHQYKHYISKESFIKETFL